MKNYKQKIKLSDLHELKKILRTLNLNTVCEEAKCPNITNCFSRKTATFMILGNICTRNCKFCNVTSGIPLKVDEDEPKRLKEAVSLMNLSHVVITSVTRDDLLDGGVSQFIKVIRELRSLNLSIEILTPDFKGDKEILNKIVEVKPDVFNHNIETTKNLSNLIRPQANYKRSLNVLEHMAKSGLLVKSGFMLGLGETEIEVKETMKDLINSGVKILTIGQYFNPKDSNWPVKKYYKDEEFKYFETCAKSLGFDYVFSGIYVRSSYMAEEVFKK